MFQIILSVLFLFLCAISFGKIRRSRGNLKFIYHWGFPFGAFVWEDLFIISLYGFIGSTVQQFIQPKHHPHFINDHFKLLRKMFGTISYQQCLIIMQVFHQIIVMIALTSLILLIILWDKLQI